MTAENRQGPRALPHQREGANFLRDREAGALFDEQGLGKSKQLIDAIMGEIQAGKLDGGLIVCPNHLKKNWKDEVRKHAPGVLAVVLGAGKVARRKALGNLRGVFYIVNYEAVINEGPVLRALLRFKRFALALDESHRIKTPGAKITRAIHHLRNYSERKYILTGTPVANRPEDMWAQSFFLDGGAALGATVEDFQRRYGTARGGYLNLNDMRAQLDIMGLRRTKESHLKLPEKTVHRIAIPLSDKQSSMYAAMRDDTRLWVEGLDGRQVLKDADEILPRLVRLVQLASNPGLIDRGYYETPAKFTALDTLLETTFAERRGEKIILWSSFVENVDLLADRYQRYKAVKVHGDVTHDQRDAVIDSFCNNPDTQLLVANPSTCREGLTLIEATTVVYCDRTFNLVDYIQSQDRIHRLGQTRPCQVILLIASDTLDEYVDFVLEQKHRVAGYIQADEDSVSAQDAAFTKPAIMAALLAPSRGNK